MKRTILSILMVFCLMLPCAFLLSACGEKSDETKFAVYYVDNLSDYNIESVDFCESYTQTESNIELNSSFYTTIVNEKNGIEQQNVTGEIYVAITLKDKTELGTLKMLVNGNEVALEEVTADTMKRYFYKFDSVPSNAKITFSGKAEYIQSSFEIEFNDITQACANYEGYTSARFILRMGDNYLIGNASEGVNYEAFKTAYNNIDKTWVLSDRLYLDVYFANSNYFLNSCDFIFAERAPIDESSPYYPIVPDREIKDEVVSLIFDGVKDGVKFTIKPDYLAYISNDIDFTMGFRSEIEIEIETNEVKYILDGGSEVDTLSYSQIKNASDIKVKIKLDNFSKTFISSDKTYLAVNQFNLTDEVSVDGDYATFSLKSPWEYYEGYVYGNISLDLLTYYVYVECEYSSEMETWYSLDEIFSDNSNLSKIEFGAVNTLNESTSPYGGYTNLNSNLYVGIVAKGNNFFYGYRDGKNFSMICKMACFSDANYDYDYSKKIVINLNGTKTIELNYVDQKLSYNDENVTISTDSSNDKIVTISFTNYDLNSIQFSVTD